MFTEFASIQLTRAELKELHAALLEHAILEDVLRRESGQEPVEHKPLLEKVEALLGEPEDVLTELDRALEDELWEYAWYAFTDEWAHYRAHEDAEREGADEADKRAHELYQKKFDAYVAEVSMMEEKPKRPIRSALGQPGSSSRPPSA